MNLCKLNILSIAVLMHRVHTKPSPVFNGRFQRISHLYFTRSSTLNFSKPKLKITGFLSGVRPNGVISLTIVQKIFKKILFSK